jgi:hypothetical protein
MKISKKQIKEIIKEEYYSILDEKENKGLWANIHAKRKRGESPAKPGDKDYPETLDIDEDENPCWKGYEMIGMKKKNGRDVPNCVPIAEEYDVENLQDSKDFMNHMKENYWRVDESTLEEAEYQGRKVKLGKPSQGDVKKFKVYVKNPKGNVVKVNFGHGGPGKGKGMSIKKSNPGARKSFRARHNCDNPGPRHKARYWSCKKW